MSKETKVFLGLVALELAVAYIVIPLGIKLAEITLYIIGR